MDNLIAAGRLLFAIPIGAFGVQYIIYGRFMVGLPPVPHWTPGGPVFAYMTGIVLIAISLSILSKTKARLSAALLGIGFFLCVVLLQTWFFNAAKISAILHNGTDRTRAFEPLALAGAAWVLAETLPNEKPSVPGTGILALFGRFLFAISMIIFGIQHFEYAKFVASLIPSWIPGHLFWTYFTGAGFIAAGVSIMIKKYGRLGATLLGIMFLLWVAVLHAPRVAAHLHNGDEWSSAFVALAMCGASFIVAGTMAKKS